MGKRIRTQLAIDISPELRNRIKVMAARRNVHMHVIIKRAIIDKLNQYEKYDEKEALRES